MEAGAGTARPERPQAALARSKLESLDLYVAAETQLLAYPRRRLRVYRLFPDVDLPADLAHQLKLWGGPSPRRPPAQFRLPL